METYYLDSNSKRILRHIIPFSFDSIKDSVTDKNYNPKEDVSWIDFLNERLTMKCENQKGKSIGDYPKGDNFEIFDHIVDLIQNDDSKNKSFVNPDIRIGFQGSVVKKNTRIIVDNYNFLIGKLGTENSGVEFDTSNIIINIPSYDLIIFKTGIGFMTIDIDILGIDRLDVLMDVNNQLKSISKSHNSKKDSEYDNFHVEFMPKSVSKEDKRVVKQSYSEWIVSELDCFEGIHFFNGRYRRFEDNTTKISMPDKAIVFTALAINSDSKTIKIERDLELKKDLLRISRGYDSKYDIKCTDSIDDNTEYYENSVFSPFENVHWAFSREGIGNIILQNSEVKFLSDDYLHRTKQNYLFLYILMLHQYYGLIHLNSKITELPYKMDAYTDLHIRNKKNTQQNYEKLLNMKDELYFFYLKCIYEEVSQITHQSHFYKKIKQTLGIRQMMDELDFEMTKISDMVVYIRNEEMKNLEKQKKRKMDFITNGGGVLALITSYNIVETKSIQLFSKLKSLFTPNSVIDDPSKYSDFEKFIISVATLVIGYSIVVVLRKLKNTIQEKYYG